MGDYPSEMDGELKWSMEVEPVGGADCALENGETEKRRGAQPIEPRGPAKDVRLAKVLRLRAALASGTYGISVHQLADSMMRCAHGQRAASRRMYSV